MRIPLCIALLCLLGTSTCEAQDDSGEDPTGWSRVILAGQANFVRQDQPSFRAEYSGSNSLPQNREHATSRLLTLYTGFRFSRNLEVLADVESAGGAGIGNALGLAGFTNVDVVRNPSLGPTPYLARALVHWTVPLEKRRLEFRVGKMSTVDYFDVNEVGSDSRWQFLNWTVVNNGAYDYAADTRGYTYGVMGEFYGGFGVFRFGEMLMPKVANGIAIDFDVARARSENLELEIERNYLKNRPTKIRPLAYLNHANMGSYRDAIDYALVYPGTTPSVVATRQQGRKKYGFGLNFEQAMTNEWRTYARLGWSDGRNESFAYTEVDREAALGTDVAGKSWGRKEDKAGFAYAVNGLSGDHREYLALGGLGFLLGDGALRYGCERIGEFYYTVHVVKGVGVAFDVQHVDEPGYNRHRGPVWVTSLRLHLEGAWDHQ